MEHLSSTFKNVFHFNSKLHNVFHTFTSTVVNLMKLGFWEHPSFTFENISIVLYFSYVL